MLRSSTNATRHRTQRSRRRRRWLLLDETGTYERGRRRPPIEIHVRVRLRLQDGAESPLLVLREAMPKRVQNEDRVVWHERQSTSFVDRLNPSPPPAP